MLHWVNIDFALSRRDGSLVQARGYSGLLDIPHTNRNVSVSSLQLAVTDKGFPIRDYLDGVAGKIISRPSIRDAIVVVPNDVQMLPVAEFKGRLASNKFEILIRTRSASRVSRPDGSVVELRALAKVKP